MRWSLTNVFRSALIIALLGYMFPWVAITGRGVLYALDGWQFAMIQPVVAEQGAEVPPPGLAGPNILTIVAFVTAVAALVLSFVTSLADNWRYSGIAALVSLLAAIVGMLWFKGVFGTSPALVLLTPETAAQLRIVEQIGYWASVVSLAAGGGIGLLGLRPKRDPN